MIVQRKSYDLYVDFARLTYVCRGYLGGYQNGKVGLSLGFLSPDLLRGNSTATLGDMPHNPR